jgi:hypothetical protein
VDNKVRVTESATSARAIKANTLDAVPPGQDATKISPLAVAGSKCKKCAIANPERGIIVNCSTTPIAMGMGLDNTLLKSSDVSVIPIESIISPKNLEIKSDFNHAKISGFDKPIPTEIHIHTGKNIVARLIIFNIPRFSISIISIQPYIGNDYF